MHMKRQYEKNKSEIQSNSYKCHTTTLKIVRGQFTILELLVIFIQPPSWR